MKEQTKLNRSSGLSVGYRVRAFCLATTALGSVMSADAKPIFMTIDVPGSSWTEVSSINNNGFIAGAYIDNTGERAFVRAPDGTITKIDVSGSIETIALSIDDGDTVAGTYYDNDGSWHGFVRLLNGTIKTFDVPGSYNTFATSISGGSITGWYNGGAGSFLRAPDGTITTFAIGSTSTEASGINANGFIAGAYGDNTGEHGFLRAPDGTITTIDVPGSKSTEATSINADGFIGGTYSDHHGEYGFLRAPDGTIKTFQVDLTPHGFTHPMSINRNGVITGFSLCQANCYPGKIESFVRAANGKIRTFEHRGSEAASINDDGSIVGFYGDDTGRRHGYLRTP